MKKVALVGNPNVGKSVIFNKITGRYVGVSNYPGTTVKVSRGKSRFEGNEYEIIDTPGAYTLAGGTEEQRITRRILLKDDIDVVVVVLDAKNLDRMLPFALLLMEAGHNVILDLNLMDEAREKGIEIDTEALEKLLNVPVVPTIATKGEGITALRKRIAEISKDPVPSSISIDYGEDLLKAIKKLTSSMKGHYSVSKRFLAILLLLGDDEAQKILQNREPNFAILDAIVKEIQQRFTRPLFYILQQHLRLKAEEISDQVISVPREARQTSKEKLSRYMMQPVTGVLILIGVLLLMYAFVGYFGAQTLVDFIEMHIFGQYIHSGLKMLLDRFVRGYTFRDVRVGYWIAELIGGEYGVITLGLRYAVAIILPVVSTFFLFFSILEDSGYLSRIAMLMDRIFKKIGLNGRAIIPLVLGTGCDTMATMITRTLDTKREKIITVLLLSLGIPCSAQLGVIFAIAPSLLGLFIWLTVVIMILLSVGYLTSKVLPGRQPIFIEEIPPLRVPQLGNVLRKTWTRLKWYLLEILPIFVLASVLIWLGRITGVFSTLLSIMEYPITWIGLPEETAEVFLFGFFRRDYGTAGLYDLKMQELITDMELIVSMVTITLFVPCIAQLGMTIRERGWKTALLIEVLVFGLAFGAGFLVHLLLTGGGF